MSEKSAEYVIIPGILEEAVWFLYEFALQMSALSVTEWTRVKDEM